MLHLLPLLFALVTCAPLLGEDYSGRIPDEYIVIYKHETVNDVIFAHQADLSLNIKYKYNISNDFRGFSAHFTPEELSKVLQTPFVEKVYCNGHVHAFCDIRQSPSTSWGLSRTSTPGCLTSPLTYEYVHHPTPGQNTNIYILDTGTKSDHDQFNGRVAPGANFMPGEPPATVDENGHGTHCAGTAAGNSFGIARNARIIPCKVLGRTGGGSFEGVIAGVDWCANDYNQPNRVPSVASMSLGAASNGGMNEAVEAAVRAGLPFAIAAGNSNGDACNYFPASAEGVMTVGATTMGAAETDDQRAYFSNYGRCVECWAPGLDIPSAYIPNSDSYAVLSGTSMACPHVAGLSAYILGTQRNLNPQQLMAEIVRMGSKGCIQNLDPESPNVLISNGCAH